MIEKDQYAIAGLGVTRQGRVPGITARKFMAEACRLAIEDAGLQRSDIDGLIYQAPAAGLSEDAPARMLGLPLKFHWAMETGGATCLAMMATAMGAIETGLADYVLVAYGDNSASIAKSPGGRSRPHGAHIGKTAIAYGEGGPPGLYAPIAQAHMARYGTTSRQLGAIAVAERQYAAINPEAFFYGKPITLEEHQNSRMIVDPLRLLDCCLITDGGAAFIVTSAERARALKRPPVYIKGVGMGSQMRLIFDGRTRDIFCESDARTAKETAFRMAGVELSDIDVAQIYDAFTIIALIQFEDYGFCKKGEGGPFVEAGNMGLEAPIPINTSGGELGWGYLQGFTPMVEGIRQIRVECGPRQVKDAELCLVTGMGAHFMSPGFGHPRLLTQACAILGK